MLLTQENTKNHFHLLLIIIPKQKKKISEIFWRRVFDFPDFQKSEKKFHQVQKIRQKTYSV